MMIVNGRMKLIDWSEARQSKAGFKDSGFRVHVPGAVRSPRRFRRMRRRWLRGFPVFLLHERDFRRSRTHRWFGKFKESNCRQPFHLNDITLGNNNGFEAGLRWRGWARPSGMRSQRPRRRCQYVPDATRAGPHPKANPARPDQTGASRPRVRSGVGCGCPS